MPLTCPSILWSHHSLEGCPAYLAPVPGQETPDKPWQTRRPCSFPPTQIKWQSGTDICEVAIRQHASQKQLYGKARQWCLLPNIWWSSDFKGIIDRHTLWEGLICGDCFSLPDSVNARFVDLKHRARHVVFSFCLLPPGQLLLVSIFSYPDQVYEKVCLSVSVFYLTKIC